MLFVPQWLLQSSSPPTPNDDIKQPSLAEKLEHYKANGERPPSSRIDPTLQQRVFQPTSFTELWKYGAFLASKATDLASELVRHQFLGARKKSWGIEMTMLTALMRNIGKNTALTNLNTLRTVMAISGLAPLPSDAIVTPVTFCAPRRRLRGFLSEYDAKEDGKRVISGEWIVGKRLWLRLQDEWRRAKVDENGRRPRHKQERVILFLHGGAYYMFSAATHRTITIPLSKYTDARVFALDYRLAPETRFPGQLHDAVLAYLRLIEDLHIPPENMLICGDSAGGGLTMSLLLYLRDNNYPLPAGAIVMSPWVDLTMSCDSWDSNAEFDLVPIPEAGDHLNPILCFLGPEGMTKYLTHPYASPLFGSMDGLPPMLIQTGDAEVLRDESMLLAHKATLAGVNIRHEIYEDQVHVFQMFPFIAAAQKAMMGCRDFVNGIMTKRKGSEIKEMGKGVEAILQREIANNTARVVRGDGSIMDDQRPTDLSKSRRTSGYDTPDEKSSSSEPEPSWVDNSAIAKKKDSEDPRDGTSVDCLEDDMDEPESPISFKPKKRSPTAASLPLGHPANSPTSQSRTGYFGSIDSSPIMSPGHQLDTWNSHLHDKAGSNRKLTRHRTQMHMNFTTANQPTPPPLRSPSIPSVRRRERALSHPDIFQLCQSWSERGPANDPVRIDARANPPS
ncbi:hypothetical protein CPB86DRAFT_732917 [Serendipita vermifera]|nr:hypothetical protein CPB86DRAFT_732917 [Serendipita vermifera]